MAKIGRPSSFTQEIADEICERLSQGEPLAVICRDDAMPHPTTFRRWCEADKTLAIAYACAREDGFDAIAARARLTARNKAEADGGDSTGDVQRDKLIIETDLKLLAKWDPKRYGDLIKLSGADGQSPVPVVTLNADMTAAQAAEAYAKLIG